MFYQLAFSGLLAISALQGLNGLPSQGFGHSKRAAECKSFDGSILDKNFWSVEGSADMYEAEGNGAKLNLIKPESYEEKLDPAEDFHFNTAIGDGPTFTYKYQLQYGRISARVQPPKANGAVTAFIFKSKTKDEIDFELVQGPDDAQTNYFWRGDARTGLHGEHDKIDTTSRTRTYTIEWTPDYMAWFIDGKKIREVTEIETKKGKTSQYPSTLSEVQLGLWDGSEAAGTAKWAQGPIDWEKHDEVFARVENVKVECYPFNE
ncbi:unnamed protein product [Cunninghamella blakesleeana]